MNYSIELCKTLTLQSSVNDGLGVLKVNCSNGLALVLSDSNKSVLGVAAVWTPLPTDHNDEGHRVNSLHLQEKA